MNLQAFEPTDARKATSGESCKEVGWTMEETRKSMATVAKANIGGVAWSLSPRAQLRACADAESLWVGLAVLTPSTSTIGTLLAPSISHICPRAWRQCLRNCKSAWLLLSLGLRRYASWRARPPHATHASASWPERKSGGRTVCVLRERTPHPICPAQARYARNETQPCCPHRHTHGSCSANCHQVLW